MQSASAVADTGSYSAHASVPSGHCCSSRGRIVDSGPGTVNTRLPHTDAVAARLLVLPTGTAVTLADIERVCGLIALMVRAGAPLRQRLAALDRDSPAAR